MFCFLYRTDECVDNTDCADNAQCVAGQCKCNEGFGGNGKVQCMGKFGWNPLLISKLTMLIWSKNCEPFNSGQS